MGFPSKPPQTRYQLPTQIPGKCHLEAAPACDARGQSVAGICGHFYSLLPLCLRGSMWFPCFFVGQGFLFGPVGSVVLWFCGFDHRPVWPISSFPWQGLCVKGGNIKEPCVQARATLFRNPTAHAALWKMFKQVLRGTAAEDIVHV